MCYRQYQRDQRARWAMHPRPSLVLLSFAVLSLVLSLPRRLSPLAAEEVLLLMAVLMASAARALKAQAYVQLDAPALVPFHASL